MADKVHGLDINGDQWELQDLPLTGQVALLQNEVDQLKQEDVYSTEEVDTGKKWIDGKPIYRRVFYINNPAINWSRVSLNAHDIDWIVKHEYTAKRTGGAVITEYYRANTDNYGVHLLVDNGTLYYYCQSNSAFSAMSITVEYTKTTD